MRIVDGRSERRHKREQPKPAPVLEREYGYQKQRQQPRAPQPNAEIRYEGEQTNMEMRWNLSF